MQNSASKDRQTIPYQVDTYSARIALRYNWARDNNGNAERFCTAPNSAPMTKYVKYEKKIAGEDLQGKPRSPRIRVGGYAILGRTIDKCRALRSGRHVNIT